MHRTDTAIEPTTRPTTSPPTSTGSTPATGPTADPTPVEVKPAGLGLSIPQIVGGALAAMTAAALGSQLSVAGTIAGAAVASVVAAVAGAIYTASLRHTGDKVKSVWVGRVETPASTDTVSPSSTGTVPTEALGAAPPVAAPPAALVGLERSDTGRRAIWKRIAIATVATFVLAAGALTGFELLTGTALSGGSGTTIEQVRENRASDRGQQDEPTGSDPTAPAEDASTEAGDPAPSETTEPSTAPSDGESTSPSEAPSEPSAEPSQSSEPSATPSADPTEAEQSGAETGG